MTPEAHALLVEHTQLTYTFAAYAAVFLAMFLFTWRMYRRTAALVQEAALLREEYDEDGGRDTAQEGPPLNM